MMRLRDERDRLEQTNRKALWAGWFVGIAAGVGVGALVTLIPHSTKTPLLIAVAALVTGGAGVVLYQRLDQEGLDGKLVPLALAFYGIILIGQGVFQPFGRDEYGDKTYFGDTIVGVLFIAAGWYAGSRVHRFIMDRAGFVYFEKQWRTEEGAASMKAFREEEARERAQREKETLL